MLIFKGLKISQKAFKTEKSRDFSVLIHPPLRTDPLNLILFIQAQGLSNW